MREAETGVTEDGLMTVTLTQGRTVEDLLLLLITDTPVVMVPVKEAPSLTQ